MVFTNYGILMAGIGWDTWIHSKVLTPYRDQRPRSRRTRYQHSSRAGWLRGVEHFKILYRLCEWKIHIVVALVVLMVGMGDTKLLAVFYILSPVPDGGDHITPPVCTEHRTFR